jgi:hypothetical protein
MSAKRPTRAEVSRVAARMLATLETARIDIPGIDTDDGPFGRSWRDQMVAATAAGLWAAQKPASGQEAHDAILALEIPESVQQYDAARNMWIAHSCWKLAERRLGVTEGE